MISTLSIPMSGRRSGKVSASSMTVRFSGVCEATCPKLSPVTESPTVLAFG